MRTRYRRWTLVISVAFALACGGSPAVTPSPSPAPPSPSAADSTSNFDVHEWGLVDVAANGSVELAAGPGSTFSVPAPRPDAPPISVRKPVVYFHLDAGAAPVALAVTVDVPGGRILEHWPVAAVATARATFADLELVPCDPSRGRSLTRELAPACESLDGVCEVRDLPSYVASDASCVKQDGAMLPHALLFYRADLPALDLPYLVTRSSDGSAALRVNPVYPADSIPTGEIVRIHRDRSRIGVARVATPRGAESVVLPRPTELLDPAAERSRLVASLVAAGLSAGEAEAFAEAWAMELFGPVTAPRATTNVDDLLLYALPRIAIDRTAPLHVTPPARRTERVWLVRVELPR